MAGYKMKYICRRFLCGIKSVGNFYLNGFREMTIGKTLWAIILIKLFIFFVVIKLLFFPNLLAKNYDKDEDRAAHVRNNLTSR